LILISILILIYNVNYSQVSNTSETYYTPSGIFDNVFDKDGTIYKLSDITVGKNYVLKNGATISNNLLCTSGIFELYFETGCGMENTAIAIQNQRRAILCQAFQDISDFINSPLKNAGNTNKVKIWIRSPTSLSLPANAGGSASAFYSLPTGQYAFNPTGISPVGGLVDNEIWKTIHTGLNSFTNTVFPIISSQNSTSFYHGWACFNFAGTVNWNLDYNKYNSSTAYPLNYIDFYSTIIHEITHALGFNSLINYNGESIIQSVNGVSYGRYYTRYDKNLKTSSNLSLINNIPTTGGEMYNFNYTAPNSVLYPNCSLTPPVFNGNSGAFNCPTSIKYVGSTTVPVYNSPCFENGSSLSHFEDACYNGNTNDQYFMMSERASGLIAKRTLTNEERQVLCDIGYSVKGTFGSTSNFTYKNYGVTNCSGITVAGVNDGFTTTGAYVFQGNSGADITISGILNNDYTGGTTANLRFEFVQDLYDPNAIFSATTGSNATSFTIKTYVPGIHLLRYVPFDNITNQRGNITYIYVNVLNNCAITDYCNLVRNGNFENHNYPPNYTSQIYKACGWQNASYRPSSDYFNSDATNTSLGIPSNFNGNQSDKIAGNHAYVGMYIAPNRLGLLENNYSESIKTELLSPLLPNTQYQLTFDVSMADNYLTNAIKFQAFITDVNLELTTGGIIPISNITSDKVFLTNPTFSSSTSANIWETITFTFTTGSNTNLKYLYIGGLNNVQFQGTGESYYYIDNVSLTRVLAPDFLDAINDNFSIPIYGVSEGVTESVYSNDLYNAVTSTSSSLQNVIFTLVAPLSIAGAAINSSGIITIPGGTPAGTYTLTYKLSTIGNCNITDTATVTITVLTTTPPLVFALRANNSVDKIGIQSNGKIIIMGNFTAYNNISKKYIARLNTDLTLDQTFSVSGLLNSTYTPYSYDFIIQPDDKIILVGRNQEIGYSNGTSRGIVRLNADGSADTTFNNVSGANQGLPTGVDQYIRAVTLQPDGKILVGTGSSSQSDIYFNGTVVKCVFRLLPNGVLDNQTGTGFTNYPYNFISNNIQGFIDKIVYLKGATTSLDRILVAGPNSGTGSSSEQPNVFKLNLNGSLDTTFAVGNTGTNIFGSPYNSCNYCWTPVQKIIIQPDGKIIIVGSFNTYNGSPKQNSVRLFSNGTVDNSFNLTPNRAIKDIEYSPTENCYFISGEFTSLNGTLKNRLAKIDLNGNIINTFDIGTGTNHSIIPIQNSVRSLKLQSDGKLIIGGYFDTYNQISATNITRIRPNIAGSQLKNSLGLIKYQSEPEIDITTNNKITIYPNPSDGIYNFNLTVEDDDTQIQVFNLLGEQVFSGLLTGKQENKIDLSNLTKGCYLVKLSNSESITTHKLIKK
jgi:uncharacterized delta-60 repeat protein